MDQDEFYETKEETGREIRKLNATCFVNYMNNALVVGITPFLMDWSVYGTMYSFGILNVFCGLFSRTAFVSATMGCSASDLRHTSTRPRFAICCSTHLTA